jgi:Ca-activated chloride channel homolog
MSSVGAAELPTRCSEDAMIVFDASGSMVADGEASVRRIDEARRALARVLPQVTRYRRIGLITYGPGPFEQCNVQLNFQPVPNAAERILRAVGSLEPAGRTPLTTAVEDAANVLDFRHRPGAVVLVTDGEETCSRSPCDLAKKLHALAKALTIHVIAYRLEIGWDGQQGRLETKCLSDYNNGLYVPVSTEEELVASLQKTLGCPLVSQN